MTKKKLERIIISIFLLWCIALLVQGLRSLQKKPEVDKSSPYLVFCDVGQGDSVLFMIGEWQMIIDGGPDNGKALECLRQYLPEEDKTIELMVLTHPDLDHFGGLTDIWDAYLVEKVMMPPADKGTASFAALEERIQAAVGENRTKLMHCPEGEIRPKEGININFWATYMEKWCQNTEEKANIPEDETNNASVVTLLDINEIRAAFLGDLETAGEEKLVDVHEKRVEILKIAHHGAKTATGEKMLQAWQPAKAVISVGKNSYGHPTQQTLGRLNEAGAQIYRTDEIGNIVFRFANGEWNEEEQTEIEENWVNLLLKLGK